MEENTQGGLSAAEEAYFTSGGETPIEAPAPEQKEAPDVQGQEGLQTEAEKQVEQEARDRDPANGRFVPHGAFHAEREEHRKTRAALEEIRQRSAVLEDRWNTLLKVQQPEQVKEQEPPDPNVDIFAAYKWQAEQVKALEAKVTGREKAEAEARTAHEQEAAIWNEWQRSASDFKAQTADFADAATHMAETRDRQLAGLAKVYPELATKEGRDRQINAELRQIIVQAKQQNVSPAEAVYEMAKAWGYAGKAPETNGKLELPGNLAQIAKAQEQAKTLGQTNARSGSDALTAEAIANMPMAEFEQWLKSPDNQKRFNAVMGG